MKFKLSVLLVLISSLTLTSATVWAQATAQITGTVKDPSGAVLPGVEVKATQTETGIVRMTISNETGTFVLPNLPTGMYRLEAALAGFRTYVQNNIVLQVNSNPTINVTMEIGQIAESVEVQANAAQVETRNTAVGTVIENQRILELPLNGRQVTDLITLAGGAVQDGTADNKGWQGSASAGLISIAGGQDFGVGYTLDGAMYSDVQEGNALPLPFPDALQEFKVENSGSAANGAARSGGAVAAVTKSGTNEIHGDAFEFVRNYDFNARNFFASKRDSLKRNQYGGTIGGPLQKDKLFFFGGYQGTKTRSDPTGVTNFVPTAQMLAGDFTTITSPACNAGKQITLKGPFVNNRINPALLDGPALTVANKLLSNPLSTPIDGCGTVNWGAIQKIDEWQLVDKTDYQINAKNSIFFRNLFTTYAVPTPFGLSGNLLTTATGGWDNLASSYAFGDTYLISGSTVNAFRLTVNRTAAHRIGASFFGPQDIGVNAHSVPDHAMAINVSGGFIVGNGSYSDATFRTTAYQLSDEVNVIKGNHQIAFGGIVANWRENNYSHTSSLGAYTFNGSITGLGMADFLTGNLATLNEGSQTAWSDREAYVLAYVQDVWKLTPRFTANYGIRWEPSFPLALKQGAAYGFDINRYIAGTTSTVFPTAPAGLYFPGDPGFPSGGRTYSPNYKQFAPRAGFAFDPKGDGKTSIRSSIGFAYDFNATLSVGGAASAPPYGVRITDSGPKGGFDNPWQGVAGGDPFPYVLDRNNPRFPAASGFQPPMSYTMPNPRVLNWNLSIQREIPSNFLVSATYIGSHTTHLWMEQGFNDSTFIPGNCAAGQYGLTAAGPCSSTSNAQQRRPLSLLNPTAGAAFGLVDLADPNGSAFYNGMLLSIQRRAAKGVNVGANYTFSHCIGDVTPFGGSFSNSANNNTYLQVNNRRYDRGNCLSDRRQIFNMTVVAATPKFSNAALRYAASGWTASALYRYNAGKPFQALTGVDRLLNADITPQRVDQVLSNPYGDRSAVNNYLNPSAFAQPALGVYGNMRGYALVGPPSFGLDMAITRSFVIPSHEGQRVEVRGEAFNVTNSLRRDPLSTGNPLYDPTTFYTYSNTSTFGQIKNAQDPRIMQFAIKYVF